MSRHDNKGGTAGKEAGTVVQLVGLQWLHELQMQVLTMTAVIYATLCC